MKNAPMHWTPEKHEQLCSLVRQGVRYAEIANIMGLTYNQVMGHWKRKKWVYPASKSFWTPERHAMMCALLDEGLTTSEVGRRMGKTKNAIIGRCHRSGMCEARYTGPTWMERLDALRDQMDAALAESAAIPRIPVPARSNTGRAEARRGDGFGVRALGHGQNGSSAVRALTGTFR